MSLVINIWTQIYLIERPAHKFAILLNMLNQNKMHPLWFDTKALPEIYEEKKEHWRSQTKIRYKKMTNVVGQVI